MKSLLRVVLRVVLGAVVCLVASLTLAAQVYPGRGGYGRGGNNNNVTPVPDAVATFDGIFKSADKKFLEIQVDDSGDIMRMYITRTTKFVRDGKTVKVSDFHDGDKVVAEATRDARLNLLAVKVEIKPPDAKPAPEK
jgi:hypothetical protein